MRVLHPEATRSGSLARLKRQRESVEPWNEPDAEFHHVGDGIFKLKFPDDLESMRERRALVHQTYRRLIEDLSTADL